MKILFVLPRMISGGVERVTLNLVRKFVADGHGCRLALRRAYGELLPEACALAPVEELAHSHLHQFVPRLAQLIRREQPTHIVTAFADIGVLTWAAMRLARSKARWVHGVHNTHARVTMHAGAFGKLRYLLDRRLAAFVYRHADAVVAVSEGIHAELLDQFHANPARVVTIYNPAVPEKELIEIRPPRHAADQPYSIIALGRLTPQKGFDVLIDAMHAVAPPWRLDIWGEGPERDALESRITASGLTHSIRLCGYTDRPFELLRAADLFVLSSRYEGFANVVVEALACQCQIVATDCPHGPREILLDGELGQLVAPEDAAALASAITAVRDGVQVSPQRMLARAGDFTHTMAYQRWLELLQTPPNG